MSDAKYFQRGKIQELRSELSSEKKDPKHQRKKMVMKKIVANMTMGNDMSSLFNDVVNCMQVNVLEIKKMVYLYLINYSRSKPDLAGNAVVFFLRDVNDHNPLIRALALRTMSYIHVKEVMEGLLEPLRKGLKDSDPYVRKTAAICVPKFYLYDRNKADEEGFIAMLKDLLLDSNPTVVANAVVALAEISERSPDLTLQLNIRIASKLIAALGECSEWGQAYILETLLYVVPQEPGDAEMLAERVAPRLQHANASVVLNAVKLIIYLMNYMSKLEDVQNMLKKLAPPLVTLLSSGPEVQYVALRNILLIIQKLPSILKDEIKVFFCKYNDPIYVKLAKLEIIFRLATSSNVGQVLSELVEYASEVDVDFVRKSVRAIGRLAIKIPSSAQRCISALLDLIQTKVNYVVQEGIVVIRDIFRKYPNKYESIIGKLCENLDSLDEPEAKSAMIWIIGQYADRIENSDEILDGFMDSFLEDPPEVQLSLLTAVVKLFIKRPTVGQELVPKILKWATEEVDNPDLRDRGYFYWRLLSVDPAAAKAVILSEHPEISTETENMEIGLLDELLLNLSTLASVYHKIPGSFIPNAKSRFLADSKVLHVLAVSKPENNTKPKNTTDNPAPIDGSFNNPYTNEVAPVNDQIVNLLDLDSGDFVSAMGATNSMTDFGNGELADSNVSYGSNLLGGNYLGNTGSQYDSARSNSLNSYTHVNSIFGTDGNFGQVPRTESPFGTPSNGGFGSTGGSGFFDSSQTQTSIFNTPNSDTMQQSLFTNSTGDLNSFNNTKQGQNVFDSSLRTSSYSSTGGIQASGSYDNNHNFANQFSNSTGTIDTNQQNSLSNGFNQLQVSDSFVPVKTLLLDPQTSQGIEVYVTFARRSGRKQMELQFINRSNLTLTDFAMQLNRNTFGIAMESALEVPPLAPHQSHTSYVLLSLEGPAAQTDPLNLLQVAFKSNVGVFYSQTKVPLHILFSEKGCLEQNDFLSNWRDLSSQPEYQFQVNTTNPVSTTEWLRNKLHTNNVFTVADRNINGKIYMFISCMLDDSTLFLVELTFNGPGSVVFSISTKLVPNTGSLGPASTSLLPIFQSAMEGILQS